MIDIKTYIIKNFTKFKVVHSIPGRIRLKINNASKIPKEAAMYDKYVIEGIDYVVSTLEKKLKETLSKV